MPRMNGTGPMGMGSRTGRAQGRCNGIAQPAETGLRGGGRGCTGGGHQRIQGGDRPRGMGRGRMENLPTQEQTPLEAQLTALQTRMERLESKHESK